tara:strand:- start:15851 stop:17173 length:1323 start_codon:yes stop_codon:yes gene_type:complete
LIEDPFLFSFISILLIEVVKLTTGFFVGLLILVLLIILSALVSGSEVSFFSLNTSDLDKLKNIDEVKEEKIRNVLRKPKELLATILIANNFINVGIIILSSYLTSEFFIFNNSSIMQFVFQVIIITFVLVLLGEITPKVYAKKNAISFSKNILPLIQFCRVLFLPMSTILISATSFIDRRLKQKSSQISLHEISQAIDLTSKGEELLDEKKILKSIVEFSNIDVKEIMKSRTDVIALDINTSYQGVLNLIKSSSYSRIPVFDKSFDNVKGVLHIKDLIPHISKENIDWFSLCHEAFFVPETKKINDLLNEFQEKKIHLAIVVDEYGGTSGIVTLEDVLEEIVGEINDEFDDDGHHYSKIDKDTYIFEAKTSLNDFLKIVEAESDYFNQIKGDSDSIAGLILEKTGVIPKISEKIEFPPYMFTIESSDERRIKRVKVNIKR